MLETPQARAWAEAARLPRTQTVQTAVPPLGGGPFRRLPRLQPIPLEHHLLLSEVCLEALLLHELQAHLLLVVCI